MLGRLLPFYVVFTGLGIAIGDLGRGLRWCLRRCLGLPSAEEAEPFVLVEYREIDFHGHIFPDIRRRMYGDNHG
jgi:hypothetical protein